MPALGTDAELLVLRFLAILDIGSFPKYKLKGENLKYKCL